jgi:hypothetical protein
LSAVAEHARPQVRTLRHMRERSRTRLRMRLGTGGGTASLTVQFGQ